MSNSSLYSSESIDKPSRSSSYRGLLFELITDFFLPSLTRRLDSFSSHVIRLEVAAACLSALSTFCFSTPVDSQTSELNGWSIRAVTLVNTGFVAVAGIASRLSILTKLVADFFLFFATSFLRVFRRRTSFLRRSCFFSRPGFLMRTFLSFRIFSVRRRIFCFLVVFWLFSFNLETVE